MPGAEALLGISIGMRAAPFPGAFHNVFQAGKLRPPMQLAPDFLRTGHEDGGITGPAWCFQGRNGMTGYAAYRFDNFAHAESPAVAQIVNQFLFSIQCFKSQKVRGGQVGDVYVIAHASAIGCGIVGSEDRKLFALPLSYFQRNGDQMRLRPVIFSVNARGPGGIEITQTGVAQAVDTMKPGQHVLDEKFRFSIGIGGKKRVILLDGRSYGIAIESSGGGKDNSRNAVSENGFEQGQAAGGIIAEVALGNFHRFAGFDQRGKMHYPLKFFFVEKKIQCGTVADIALNEIRSRGQGAAPSVREIIEDGDFVPSFEKLGGHHASDVSDSASHKHMLGHEPPSPLDLRIRFASFGMVPCARDLWIHQKMKRGSIENRAAGLQRPIQEDRGKSTHAESCFDDSRAAEMNRMPATPSSTVGTSKEEGAGARPASRAEICSARSE